MSLCEYLALLTVITWTSGPVVKPLASMSLRRVRSDNAGTFTKAYQYICNNVMWLSNLELMPTFTGAIALEVEVGCTTFSVCMIGT